MQTQKELKKLSESVKKIGKEQIYFKSGCRVLDKLLGGKKGYGGWCCSQSKNYKIKDT